MSTVQILNIQEAGQDFLLLKDADTSVRLEFADDHDFTKEDSAGFFRPLVGKPAAIPVSNDTGNFFIAVDMWRDLFGNFKVIPFHFAISKVEFRHLEYERWREKLATWKAVRHQKDVLQCAICGEERECTTYASPDTPIFGDSSHDICESCEKKVGLAW